MTRIVLSERLKGCEYDKVDAWFDLFEEKVCANGVDPKNVYSMDETNVKLGDKSSKYAFQRVEENDVYPPDDNDAEYVTILETISMDGKSLPPFVIFKGRKLQKTWMSKVKSKDWCYKTSNTGWTNNEMAVQWLRE